MNSYCHSISRKYVHALLFLCRYIDMVIQNGTADCGLFALASATALANGEEPGSFVFDQEQMRPHLIRCLETGKAEQFPIKKSRRKPKKVKSTVKVPVFCTCRMPKRSDFAMIECSACRESFHVDVCVDVNTWAFDRSTKWLCTSC